jgi:hypothetical protein
MFPSGGKLALDGGGLGFLPLLPKRLRESEQ